MKNFFETFNTFFSSETTHTILMVLLVVTAAIFLGLVMGKKKKLKTQAIAEIGLALALSAVLSEVKIGVFWKEGGSVTAASMVPILIIAFRYGPKIGISTGFVYGIIQLILEPYVVHPVQLFLDYPFAFSMIGLAGFFQKRKILGIITGLTGRFIMHFISGTIYFASYAPPGWSPVIYSFIYNISYILPEIIISIIVFELAGKTILEALEPKGQEV